MTKVEWPDLTFPPVNQYILIPALEFKQLMEAYGIPNPGYRNVHFSEGVAIQSEESDGLLRSTES
jgi:hypothetical protein